MEYFDFKERIIKDVALEAHNNGNISESGSGWFILFIIEGGREHENSNYNRRK